MPVNHICIDLETYRTRCPRALAVLTEKEAANSWQDVMYAEVLCAAIATDFEPELEMFSAMPDANAEHEALTALAESLNELADADTVWIGQNIKNYDLPILLNRWRRYRITPPRHFPVWTGRYWTGRIFDTLERTPAKNPIKGKTLAAICAAYGLEAKSIQWRNEPMTGSRVADAFEAGEYQLILDYCAQDAIDEYALFQVMTFNGGHGGFERDDSLSESLTEIDQSTLTPGLKWQSARTVLQQAGLL